MTSWASNRSLPPLSTDKLFCKTSLSGYGSNFFNFFMCYLFAQAKQKKLYLNDTKNNLSKEYHLILDSLQPLPGIEYTILNGLTIQQMQPKELNAFYNGLSKEFLSKEAKRIFRFNSATQTKIDAFHTSLPAFDCGIHVRTGDKITTGEMKAIPFENYLEALHRYQVTSKKDNLHIYLMTDSQKVIDWFQTKKDPSWTFVSIPSPYRFTEGHDQAIYNKRSREINFQCFYHFWAEVQVMQQCPHIVCTFSSNIGRFLDLMKKGTIESLD